MIVNFKKTPYAIVELDAKDMETLKKGYDIIRESYFVQDDPILVRVYCCQLGEPPEDHD